MCRTVSTVLVAFIVEQQTMGESPGARLDLFVSATRPCTCRLARLYDRPVEVMGRLVCG